MEGCGKEAWNKRIISTRPLLNPPLPYASHIQVVNDPNGTAYAFLADNGAIWQC